MENHSRRLIKKLSLQQRFLRPLQLSSGLAKINSSSSQPETNHLFNRVTTHLVTQNVGGIYHGFLNELNELLSSFWKIFFVLVTSNFSVTSLVSLTLVSISLVLLTCALRQLQVPAANAAKFPWPAG